MNFSHKNLKELAEFFNNICENISDEELEDPLFQDIAWKSIFNKFLTYNIVMSKFYNQTEKKKEEIG